MNGTHLDPSSRSIWVDIYKIGSSVRFPKRTPEGIAFKRVDITPEFVAAMLDSFDRLTSAGDRVTVLKEHDADGEHYGTVHELRVQDDWLQARLSLVPSLWEAYDDQRVVEFSPAFVEVLYDPHTGDRYQNVLVEVTVTAMALQHTLRPPQQTNPGSALVALVASGALIIEVEMEPEEEEVTPAEEEVAEEAPAEEVVEEEEAAMTLEEAMAKIEELEAKCQEYEAAMAEKEGEMEVAAANFTTQIQALEDSMVKRDLLSAGVPVERHDALVKLRRVDAELFDASVQNLATDRQAPIGVVGTAPVGESHDASRILAEAERAGISYGKGLGPWLGKHYPEQAAEVAALAASNFNNKH